LASRVSVDVNDAAIISALNAPGRAVFQWRDDLGNAIVSAARALSPVNDPLNAVHRGGLVGTYKGSWRFSRAGSNQHRVRLTVINDSDHAEFVEYGRSPSESWERFSWTRWQGAIRVARFGTRGYSGRHVLQHATNSAVAAATGGTAGRI
jgi:hypothetical protein